MSAEPVGSKRSFSLYIALVIALTPIFAVIFYAVLLLSSSASCGGGFGNPDEFLGYCETTWFGDYEHAAVAYRTKPDFVANAAAADIVFLGDSRLQTAVSTEAVRAHFADSHTRFFAFGFGYGETERFPLTMLERIGAHPKVVVINADGFFTWRMSQISDAILGGSRWERAATYARYLPKILFERHIEGLCRLASGLCTLRPQPRSWMRSSTDGRWRWINGDPDRADRWIRDMRDRPFDPGMVSKSRAAAVDAIGRLRALHVQPSCIILTGVPNPVFQSETWAKATAAMLGVPFVQPRLTGLAVRDGLHLNRPSAEIWSAVFLQEADPIIRKCLADTVR